MRGHIKKDNLGNREKDASRQVIELKKEISDLKTGWQRTQADFDNFRKRTEEERQEFLEFQKADFITSIVPVLDNFRRAFAHTKEKDETPVIAGMRQIKKQLEDILENEGLKQIPASKGVTFDPELHEAISFEENDDIAIDAIIDELESGWVFKDKVIIPAKVRVSKGK